MEPLPISREQYQLVCNLFAELVDLDETARCRLLQERDIHPSVRLEVESLLSYVIDEEDVELRPTRRALDGR